MVPKGASCTAHGEPAIEICVRCGAFVCTRCRGPGDISRCASCYRRQIDEGPSRLAFGAMVLGTFGFCGFVPGIVGLVLSYRELARIHRGEASVRGKAYAELARNLGWLHVGALLLIAAELIWRLA